MILILIIFITQQNSPHNRYQNYSTKLQISKLLNKITDIKITQQNSPQNRYKNKPIATIKFERKRKSWLQQSISFSLTHSSFLTFFFFVSALPINRQQKYE